MSVVREEPCPLPVCAVCGLEVIGDRDPLHVGCVPVSQAWRDADDEALVWLSGRLRKLVEQADRGLLTSFDLAVQASNVCSLARCPAPEVR